MILRLMLERDGHRVVAVTNGTDAIAAVMQESFGVIVTDFHMPGMSGMDVIRRLREVDVQTPVILSSGGASQEEIDACINSGASAFLRKPLDAGKLLPLVRRLGASV